ATDANNCLYEDSVEITEPETSLTVEITEVNDALCHGVDDGNIDITASGGTPPYIYAWTTDNGSGLVTDAEDQIAVGAGTYYLTVIDNNDCEANLSVTVNEPEAITIVSEDVVDATSEAASDGSITVEATGGTGTLSYTLTPGDEVNVTGVFENLSPDDYTIEITDENSCGPVTSNLTVSFPDAINSPSLAENIRLYPNPTSANLTVEIDVQQEETFTIEILNIAGQRLFKEITQANGKLKKELNLSDYAKGIYFIKISTEGFYYQEKVIFQ
ncbi:MAG TPA: T9SS type A sorting domain-containing protein, partial [Bacteroidales bacterium]|nr:T9SS type A sorting domain-containing protein [Bacteroidales bacterium]